LLFIRQQARNLVFPLKEFRCTAHFCAALVYLLMLLTPPLRLFQQLQPK